MGGRPVPGRGLRASENADVSLSLWLHLVSDSADGSDGQIDCGNGVCSCGFGSRNQSVRLRDGESGQKRAAVDTQSGLENEGGASPESGAGCPPVLSAGVVEADSPHQRSGSERAAPGIDQGAGGAVQ